jgi:nucleoside-diphosphate-sugar epimerase
MKKVLITGGSGYIGSVLTEVLLRKYKVTIFDNLLYNQKSILHHFANKNFKFIHGDVRDNSKLIDLVKEHDIIIPLAAIVGAPACDLYKSESSDVNYIQIKKIVENLSNNQSLIIPNTNSQYGSSESIITEDSPFKPLSHYARTKCDAEKCVIDSGNGISLRLATVFGISPRMRLDLLVNDFTYRSYNDGFLVLFESHFKRNYIHVRDVCKAFDFMIENYDNCKNQAYNVGLSSANLSKIELALKIKEYIPKLIIKEDQFSQDKDKRNYIVSNEKIEKLGWSPDYNIDIGIQELLAAYPIIKNTLNKNFTNL